VCGASFGPRDCPPPLNGGDGTSEYVQYGPCRYHLSIHSVCRNTTPVVQLRHILEISGVCCGRFQPLSSLTFPPSNEAIGTQREKGVEHPQQRQGVLMVKGLRGFWRGPWSGKERTGRGLEREEEPGRGLGGPACLSACLLLLIPSSSAIPCYCPFATPCSRRGSRCCRKK
jgi:hypothetical protein